jgi:type I restriction enzyme, S subunit
VTVSARVERELPEAYVNQHIALVRLVRPELSRFILLWLQADCAGRTELEKAAYGAGKPGLNLHNIRSFKVAFPPPAESVEILRRVSEAIAGANDAEKQLDNEAADAARLKQSILKAAFEGRLVPQDPNDEPASVLLKQIASASPPPRRRGRPARELEPT